MQEQDQRCINAIRVLASEAIDKADSGHPGMVLGAAPMAYTLFAKHLVFNPADPDWHNRDRFVLSAGHGSMLLYALLNMFGYDLPMAEIKRFRQLHSKTPGHPEYGLTPGVEATTGPLGQGIAMAVGFAMAEAHLAAKFNRPEYPVCDHYTYALCGDGCMQEGVSAEASSLAGTLKLDRLILFYDRNRITIEGDIQCTFCEDVGTRYRAYGWHVIEGIDGDDTDAIAQAIKEAKKTDMPSLIIVDTRIARHSPLEGSEASHGAPLGAENTAALRKNLGWTAEPFTVPSEVYDTCGCRANENAKKHKAWQEMMDGYKKAHPDLYAEYTKAHAKGMPEGVDAEALLASAKAGATRNASGAVLNQLKDMIPSLFGGSADLAPSTKTVLGGEEYFTKQTPQGRNMHFGIREFAMACIANGLRLHGGVRPYCATFLVFSDYMRAAIRLGALMKQGVIFVLTHDSIGVGEDGSTHQPIEHIASFRAMPGCRVFRPADAKETVAAYLSALEFDGPTLLALSRQGLPLLDNSGLMAQKGGYVLSDCEGTPELILIGTGSEVSLCLDAAQRLTGEGKRVRVVSMPCMKLFFEQDAAYRESVLPKAVCARVGVEAAASFGWHRVVGDGGACVCLDHFGASAPGKDLFEAFGFTAENVADTARKLLS